MLYNTTKQLKELISRDFEYIKNNNKRVRIFFDIRGMAINIHDRQGSEMLARYYDRDLPVYSNKLINIFNNWFQFFEQHKLELEIIGFAEFGESKYHNEILDNTYKLRRRLERAKRVPELIRKKASDYIKSELTNLAGTLNVPGSKAVIILANEIEIDCTPSFINNYCSIDPDRYVNYIFSKDKDMVQSISDNTKQVIKVVRSDYAVLDKTNCLSKGLKVNLEKDPKYASLILSILGDSADSIPGLNGIGPKGIEKLFLDYEYDEDSEEDMITHFANSVSEVKPQVKQEIEKLRKSYKCVDFDIIIRENEELLNKAIRDKYNSTVNCSTLGSKTNKIYQVEQRLKTVHNCVSELEYAWLLRSIK